MRVMQISAFSGQGAPGKIMLGIHDVLTDYGYEGIIAWGRANSAPRQVPALQIGTKRDYYTHGVYTRLTDKCGFGSIHATKSFLKKADECRPDLIHLHMLHGYYINLEQLFHYLKERMIPTVWTLHDSWAITGHCPCFDMIGCTKWKTGCHHCPQRTHHPTSWIVDNSAWNWNKKRELFTSLDNLTIVTPSRWMAGIVRESFLKDYPVEVINNGINTDVFKPTASDVKNRLGAAGRKIVLGVSSTWAPSKGLADFCKLAEMLPDEYQIVLVGLTEKQMKTLPHNIIGIKKTENVKELVELYSAAHVFVNPTYEDNYPTTNLEALACGTPVVTYRTGGSVEAVEESRSGDVVERGDIEALAASVRSIPEHNHDEPLYSCNEKERYREYLLLYQKILSI
ncbi:MAG: glycosyltransferase [Clostridiales bacterium]|nr:glycosyltransferase [Clostridiales bacterium]